MPAQEVTRMECAACLRPLHQLYPDAWVDDRNSADCWPVNKRLPMRWVHQPTTVRVAKRAERAS